MTDIGVNLRVTDYCEQGDRQHMEDMLLTVYQHTPDKKKLDYAFLGIFDGHGGPEAAEYVKNHLLHTIIKHNDFRSDNDDDVLRAIHDGYMSIHNKMWNNLRNWPKTSYGLPSTSGTTASIAFIMRGKIYTGHVGDSRIVLGYQDEENGEWKAKPLTQDHTPESIKEKNRIEECGGKVITKYGVSRVVWNRSRTCQNGHKLNGFDETPFLAVSRSLGDFWSFNFEHHKFIVSPVPDIEVFSVDPSKHRCLVFATDGLWNVLSSDIAITNVYETEKNNIKMKNIEKQDLLNPSKILVEKAIFEWSKVKMMADNTSVITLILDLPTQQVLLEHKMQTDNMNCEDKNDCKCVTGDSQIQKFSDLADEYDILTKYLKPSNTLVGTSKLFSNIPITIPSEKLNDYTNNNSNHYNTNKTICPSIDIRSTYMTYGENMKKQKINKEFTLATNETSMFGKSSSENNQLPCDLMLLSPRNHNTSEKNKVSVVLRRSGRVPKNKKCNGCNE